MAALGGVLGLWLGRGRRLRRGRRSAGKLRDGVQHLQAMPERDTQVLEMLVGQVGENGDVNVVLGKALGVLGHAECF